MPAKPVCVHPTPEEVFPIFGTIFSRQRLITIIKHTCPRVVLYWRLFTPLITLWCMIVQRLNADHTCDAVVSHLQTGAADALDPDDPHVHPLSQRLPSENSSAYAQARARLPLAVIWAANRHLVQTVQAWLTSTPTPPTWKGHLVRLLDGTTFRLAATPALVTAYGQARNQHGPSHWVVVRSVATFCRFTQQCVAATEAWSTVSESAMVRPVLAADAPNTVVVGDCNFGHYRVAQVAQALRQHVVLRRQARQARAMLRANGVTTARTSGLDCPVTWTWCPGTQHDPTLPCDPIPGRVLFVRLTKRGFRPHEIYLFTSLTDAQTYPLEDVVALYAQRWQVELDYRHLKATLDMAEFSSKTPEMFRKELAAGILTYNLVCAVLVQAAQQAHLAPQQLSFARGLRRIRDALQTGVPAWVPATGHLTDYLLARLAQCRLMRQPYKIVYEPRKVRRRPQVYPALKGDRKAARQQTLREHGWEGDLATDPPDPSEPAAVLANMTQQHT